MKGNGMVNALVLVADYPNRQGGKAQMFVHVRNKYYIQHDIEVTVLNFAAKEGYVIDNIPVITYQMFRKGNAAYDVCISHAANIRNHYLFLKKYADRFPHLMFFYHGHEVVKIKEVYPEPYDYMKSSPLVEHIKTVFQNLYDSFKLRLWHNYLPQLANKSDFVFVSNWLYGEFQKYVGLNGNDLANHVHIIHNSVGEVFEKNSYQFAGEKKYDFITIRGNIDGSKYGIDLVDALAKRYPQYRFLILGKGHYYEVHAIPENVTWINCTLNHDEMLKYVDESRCGLLLTKEDTQGVMTCELATYGIPVITSDIEVCREVFGEIQNVKCISNDITQNAFPEIFEELISPSYDKTIKFSYGKTVNKEENLITSYHNVGGVYDFITIRSNMDSSVYAIDIVCKWAEENPRFNFLIIGKGKWFKYHIKPDNVTWIDAYLSHDEMMKYIDHSRCALMPTRRDTQGVMSCELATFGIPLITSDIGVCQEIFEGLTNVTLVGNTIAKIDFSGILTSYTLNKSINCKTEKFGYDMTVFKEESLILNKLGRY